jgi:hypothetical protein
MTLQKLLTPAHAATALLLAASALPAQGPISDKMTVTFSSPVTVEGTTLAPGEYAIRQLPSASNPRILEFSSENGTKIEVTATAIPVLDNSTPTRTSVILDQRGSDYQLKRIWVQGKDYGYEFLTSDKAQSAANRQDQGLTLTAQFTPPRTEVAQTTTTAENTTAAETAQAQPEPAPAPAPAPQPEPQPQPVETAQARPPEPAPATPQPEAQAAPQPEPTTPAMPSTSTDWSTMVLGGLMVASVGLTLKRFGF